MDGFVFYNSFYEALKNLEPDDRLAAYDAICEYALKDETSNATGTVAAILALIKPQIDANKRRRESGRLGGINTQAQRKQDASKAKAHAEQVEAKEKVKVKEKVKDKEKDKEKEKDAIDEASISAPVRDALRRWLEYKRERREPYKDMGLRSLIAQVEKHEHDDGAKAVVDVIELSMSNQWRGIIWDRIGRQTAKPNPFTAINRHDYDFTALERALDEA